MKYRKAKLKDIAQGEVFHDPDAYSQSLLARLGADNSIRGGNCLMLFLSTGIAGFADDEMMGDEFQVVGKLCGDSGIELYTWFNIEVGDFLSDCLVPLSRLSKGEGKGYRFDPDLEHYPSNGTHYNSKWRRGDPLPEGTTHMLVTGK